MKKDLLEKIQKRGYWRINFRPVKLNKTQTLPECEEIVKKNSVNLRGWDYPHFQETEDENGAVLRSSDFVEGWVDWSYHKEFWRMYKSGQFLHYLALRIDWDDEGIWIFGKPEKTPPEPLKELGVVDITYQLTEIFEFLSRLIQSGLYSEGAEVKIDLINLNGRKLLVDNPMRTGFMFDRKTGAQKYSFDKQFGAQEILESSKEIARNVILEIFQLFKWDDPPIDTIKKDQDDLLLKRF